MASRFFCPTGLPLPLASSSRILKNAPLSGPVWEYRRVGRCGDKLFGFGLGLLAPSALLSHLPRLTGEESFVEIWVLLRPPSRRAGAGAAGRGSLAFAPQGECGSFLMIWCSHPPAPLPRFGRGGRLLGLGFFYLYSLFASCLNF